MISTFLMRRMACSEQVYNMRTDTEGGCVGLEYMCSWL